jgi:hypothetical protein
MAYNAKYTQKARFTVGAGKTWATTDVDLVNDTVRIANHGYTTGQSVGLATTGAVPTGLTVTTAYYIIPVSGSKVAFATSRANAFAGTKVDLTAVGSGTNTMYGNGNGITLSDIIVPANHMVVNARYSVLVQAAATATTGTLAISVESANDIVSAAAISTNVWDKIATVTEVVGVPLINTVSTYIMTTTDRVVTFTTGTSPWTAGTIDVWLDIVPTIS